MEGRAPCDSGGVADVEKKKTRVDGAPVPSQSTRKPEPEPVPAPEPGANSPQEELQEIPGPDIESAQESKVASVGKITIESLTPASWLRLYPQLAISGIAANVLANSDFQRADGSHIHFVLDHSQSAVFSEELLPKISQAFSALFSAEISVHIEIGDARNETPAMLSQRLKEEKYVAMVNDFESDENVQELLRHFSGTLAKETIAPNKD